jgi:hypothetical protein
MTGLSRAQAVGMTGTLRFRVEGLSFWAYGDSVFEGGEDHEVAKPSRALREAVVDAARAEATTPGTGVQLLNAEGEQVILDHSSPGDGAPATLEEEG